MKPKSLIVLTLVLSLALTAMSLNLAMPGGAGTSEDDAAVEIAVDFVRRSPTFSFDGMAGTLTVVETRIMESYPVQYVVIIEFDSSHAGYGDRTGQILAQVITHHTAGIKVVNGEVVAAILDDFWDMVNQEEMETYQDEEPVTSIISPSYARDLAIDYALYNHRELSSVEAPDDWDEEDLTPQGLLGAAKTRFTEGDWIVTVSWAVVRSPVYTVEIDYNGETGFHWTGTVDQAKIVAEQEFSLLD
ncbi:MAG: hypothetical protein JSV27_12440 [Candidatus Bathyarchaeota archaeon]|nr:MAG: hypothetical protein JSV27_12440 [Candidatus Bathyarchaeota archaeon]